MKRKNWQRGGRTRKKQRNGIFGGEIMPHMQVIKLSRKLKAIEDVEKAKMEQDFIENLDQLWEDEE